MSMIEKFTFELHTPKISKKKIVLVKDIMERRHHVVLKLLAYCLYYTPELKVEVSAEMHYKPDLMVPGDHGVPQVWIDCGQVTLRKVESLAQKLRTTKIVFLKETRRELETFKKLVDKKIEHGERLEFLAFEPGFTDALAAALQRTNHFTLYEIMENIIGVAMNDDVFESCLYR